MPLATRAPCIPFATGGSFFHKGEPWTAFGTHYFADVQAEGLDSIVNFEEGQLDGH